MSKSEALRELGRARDHLSAQQYHTLRGQILSGDIAGAARGFAKIARRVARG